MPLLTGNLVVEKISVGQALQWCAREGKKVPLKHLFL